MAKFDMTPNIKSEMLLLFLWMLFMLFLGIVFDSVTAFLFTGLLSYVIWTLYNLNQLSKWLANPKKQTPECVGVWDDLYYQLYHLYKRQRSARKKLTSILNRFQKSTQALPYATIILNNLNEIEWFNPAARQMFNLHSKIDVGQRLDNLIRQPKFSSYLREKKFKKPIEFIFNQKSIAMNITPYGNGQFLVTSRDITERQKLDNMRRDFISNASHELRTPLTVMTGYIEFLQHKVTDVSTIPLERIEQQINRMNKIIAELIELARLESSEEIDHGVAVDINALLDDVYEEALTLDGGKHEIKLDKNIDDKNGVPLHNLSGSYVEIRMALSNLLTNAIRYTPEGKAIKLLAWATDSNISISVEDTGDGIDYEHIPRLTERFYRVDEGRSKEKGGTGLGLAIVKHVLDRHNANLHIHSVKGTGTTFRCDFPVSNHTI